MKSKKRDISAERVREAFDYEPETGRFCWRASGSVARAMTASGYRRVQVDGLQCMTHVLIWVFVTGCWPDFEIDHCNTNKSDNRWGNLRPATVKQNQANKSAQRNNITGVKGVYRPKRRNVYRAQIKIDQQTIYLGCYRTIEDANAAYLAAAEKAFGPFARAR